MSGGAEGAEYCIEEYLDVGFLNIFTSVDVSYSFCEIRPPL